MAQGGSSRPTQSHGDAPALHISRGEKTAQFEELESLYNEAPVGLGLFDPDFRFLRINQVLADINGVPVADHIGRTVREIVPQLADAAEPLLRRVFAEGTPLRDIVLSGATAKEPNVVRHWREDYYPVKDAEGNVRAVGAIVFDITEQKRFESRLRERDERLRAALAVSRTGTFRWMIAGDHIEADGSLDRLLLLPPGHSPRCLDDLLLCVHAADREMFGGLLRQAARDGGDVVCAFRVKAEHTGVRWLTARCRALSGNDARPLYIVGACVDMTERKEAEERQSLLVAELNHRVRNSLAAVQSIAVQTLSDDLSPSVVCEAFVGRLHALAHTHTLLADADWQGADLRHVIRSMLSAVADDPRAFGNAGSGRLRLRGQRIRLTPRATICLGMVLHELATNAARYGGFSRPGGHAAVAWSLVEKAGATALCLLWKEAGGPRVTAPLAPGFGLTFIRRSLKHELGGTANVVFPADGLSCRISVPAAGALRAA